MISRKEAKRLKSQRTGYLLRSCLLAISDDVPIKPCSHDYLNVNKAMETTEEVLKYTGLNPPELPEETQ